MVVSLDMSRMNKVKWVDKVNQVACVEAGIIGVDLEKELKNYGVCCGHEPVNINYHLIYMFIYRILVSFLLQEAGYLQELVV